MDTYTRHGEGDTARSISHVACRVKEGRYQRVHRHLLMLTVQKQTKGKCGVGKECAEFREGLGVEGHDGGLGASEVFT